MEWSKYNYLFNKNNKFYIYNSLSGFFAELEDDLFVKLNDIKTGKRLITDVDNENLQKLTKEKVFTSSNLDDYYSIKSETILNRNNQNLQLIIAPTQDCNFNCVYCYEQNRPSIYMSKEIEQSIIDFIKSYSYISDIHIVWYGGEPLMNIDTIISLTNKIKELKIPLYSEIITNGYLLNTDNIEKLNNIGIKMYQITIDGTRETHNKNRPLHDGSGTYDTIINNIRDLYGIIPDAHINLRVNINKENKNDFVSIYKEFNEKYKNNSINVYPGIIDEDIEVCKDFDSCNLDKDDVAEFRKDLFLNDNINIGLYISPERSECMARRLNAFVIDANGNLYKCFMDIGKDSKIIGNTLSGEITNLALMNRYLSAADPFNDKNCINCKLLPSCSGGCPYTRIHNEYYNTNKSTCSIFKGHVTELLTLHHESKI